MRKQLFYLSLTIVAIALPHVVAVRKACLVRLQVVVRMKSW